LPTDTFSGIEICQKSVCGRGSALDPAGRAYSAPPDPLAGFGGEAGRGKGRREGKREGRGNASAFEY